MKNSDTGIHNTRMPILPTLFAHKWKRPMNSVIFKYSITYWYLISYLWYNLKAVTLQLCTFVKTRSEWSVAPKSWCLSVTVAGVVAKTSYSCLRRYVQFRHLCRVYSSMCHKPLPSFCQYSKQWITCCPNRNYWSNAHITSPLPS